MQHQQFTHLCVMSSGRSRCESSGDEAALYGFIWRSGRPELTGQTSRSGQLWKPEKRWKSIFQRSLLQLSDVWVWSDRLGNRRASETDWHNKRTNKRCSCIDCSHTRSCSLSVPPPASPPGPPAAHPPELLHWLLLKLTIYYSLHSACGLSLEHLP